MAAPNPNNRLPTVCERVGAQHPFLDFPAGWDIEWFDTYGFEDRGRRTSKGIIAFGYETADGFQFVYAKDPSYTFTPDREDLGRAHLDWDGALFLLARFLERLVQLRTSRSATSRPSDVCSPDRPSCR